MLSGRAPFGSPGREESASVVVERIKSGAFSFDGDTWKRVSPKAKNLIQGNCMHSL